MKQITENDTDLNVSQPETNNGIKREDNGEIIFIPMNIVAEINAAREKGKSRLDGGADSLWKNLYDKYGLSDEEFHLYMEKLNENIQDTSGRINGRTKNIEEVSVDNIDGILSYLDAILDSLRETSKFEVGGRHTSQIIREALGNLKNIGGIGGNSSLFDMKVRAEEVTTSGINKRANQEEGVMQTLADKLDREDIELDSAFNLLCSTINYFSSYGETLTIKTKPLLVSFRNYFQIQKDKDKIKQLET